MLPTTARKNQICYETDFAVIYADAELNSLAMVYKRRGSSAEFRDLHHELLNVFKKSSKDRLLVDVRKMEIAAPEDQKWVAQSIIPELAKTTSRKFLNIAVVVDENIFARLAVETIEQLSNEIGYCVNRHFKDPDEARKWLQLV